MLEGGGVINRLGRSAQKSSVTKGASRISRDGGVRGFAESGKLQIEFVKMLLGVIEKNQETRIAGSERCTRAEANAAPAP